MKFSLDSTVKSKKRPNSKLKSGIRTLFSIKNAITQVFMLIYLSVPAPSPLQHVAFVETCQQDRFD